MYNLYMFIFWVKCRLPTWNQSHQLLFLHTSLISSLTTSVSVICTSCMYVHHTEFTATIPRVSQWCANLKINHPTGNMHPQFESMKQETQFCCSMWVAPDCGAVGCPRDLAASAKSHKLASQKPIAALKAVFPAFATVLSTVHIIYCSNILNLNVSVNSSF